MTSLRLICLSGLLAAGCARTVAPVAPTAPSSYRLCDDPRFSCVPASATTVTDEQPIQIDFNLASPAARSLSRAG